MTIFTKNDLFYLKYIYYFDQTEPINDIFNHSYVKKSDWNKFWDSIKKNIFVPPNNLDLWRHIGPPNYPILIIFTENDLVWPNWPPLMTLMTKVMVINMTEIIFVIVLRQKYFRPTTKIWTITLFWSRKWSKFVLFHQKSPNMAICAPMNRISIYFVKFLFKNGRKNYFWGKNNPLLPLWIPSPHKKFKMPKTDIFRIFLSKKMSFFSFF